MSGSIELHPEKGVNPRVTCCRNCGKDVGLVLLGRRDYMQKCLDCNLLHIGGVNRNSECKKNFHRIGEREPIPEGTLPLEVCDDCAALEKECEEEVAKGGVYWKCSKCGSAGAVKAGTELAKATREAHKMPTGECGVELESCPACDKKEEEEK